MGRVNRNRTIRASRAVCILKIVLAFGYNLNARSPNTGTLRRRVRNMEDSIVCRNFQNPPFEIRSRESLKLNFFNGCLPEPESSLP